jgi:hypothetical protein
MIIASIATPQACQRLKWRTALYALVMAVSTMCLPLPSCAYGPVAHVLVAYRAHVSTLNAMKKWFPNQQFSPEQQKEIVALSMAGALFHDVGYVDKRVSNLSDLLHYQRTGEFVTTLISDGVAQHRSYRDVAFAIGVLAHYAGDRKGHEGATNLLSAYFLGVTDEVGSRLAYEDNKDCHSCIEKAIDPISLADANRGEIAGFEEELNVLGRLIQQGSDYLLPAVRGFVGATFAKVYGLDSAIVEKMGWKNWMDVDLLQTYVEMLRRIDAGLRTAGKLYGFEISFSSARYTRELASKGGSEAFASCFPKAADVVAYQMTSIWMRDSMAESVALLEEYLDDSSGLAHDGPSGVKTVWSDEFSPMDINLDTNLVSTSEEYRMADAVLVRIGLKMPAKFDEHGREHRAVYFSKANPQDASALTRQVRNLDRLDTMEGQQTRSHLGAIAAAGSKPTSPPNQAGTNATSVAGPRQARTMPPLPAKLPRFGRDGDPECPPAPSSQHFAGGVTLQGSGTTIVCLPAGATTLQAWIGALAAADATNEPKSDAEKTMDRLYREKRYAHAPKQPGQASPYEALCEQKQSR